MFLSLNKKIILSIVLLFIVCFSTFGYTLYSIYNGKLQEDSLILHLRNQQYNELLYRYNILKAEIANDNRISPAIENTSAQQPLLRQETFRDQALLHNIWQILISLTVFSFLIVLMIIFLHRLVLRPINHFSKINRLVKHGNYRQRLHLPDKFFKDEFNILEQTYNNMLDNIESQISRIKEQKEFLQNIIDGIPDALRVIDFSGNIILVNETYLQKLGQTQEQTIRQKCYASLLRRKTPCTSNTEGCPLQCLQQQKSIKFIQQLPAEQYLSVSAARIEMSDRPLIIESFRDLSDDIKFSHQQKISSLGFLTASIAHEIKNNLGSMRLILESLLQNRTSDLERQKYLPLIYEQLLECIKIPERLLKLAAVSEDDRQMINCREAISEICALLDYETTRNGIKIEISSSEQILPICGNETDFKMIILNLAQNAVKAMPSGGLLSFALTQHRNFLEIDISDTGQGIPRQQLPHIFEPFYSTSEHKGHAGLGLSIVKSLLHNFGGDIKVRSKVGAGTRFTLKFPYKNKK